MGDGGLRVRGDGACGTGDDWLHVSGDGAHGTGDGS